MPLEAQACGTPVLAYGAGGALETVIPGKTGEFFNSQDTESLIELLKRFDPAKYDALAIRAHAQGYDKKIFQAKIRAYVTEKLQQLERIKEISS
jgi:glycosyltransferase involved in cell wall biosynthesis